MSTRLNKYLAQSGMWSRRKADDLIASGAVRVNGKPVTSGQQVDDGDRVTVNGVRVAPGMHHITLALHKPRGFISTTDRRMKDNVMSFIQANRRVFPIGRLDVDSSGLLLFTSDGELANRLMHPRYEHDKEYEVSTDEEVTDAHLEMLRNGVVLDDGQRTKHAAVHRHGRRSFTIIIQEGRNRQIRRMCDALGLTVRRLHRTRVANIRIGTLKAGRTREITRNELDGLLRLTGQFSE